MKPEGLGVEVTILDRTLRIVCSEDEKAELLQSVEYLDAKMREIRENGKVLGNERVAIMAALNIAHELLSMRSAGGFDNETYRRRMQKMAATIDEAMSAQEDLF